MMRWKSLLHPLLNDSSHLLDRKSVADGLRWRFVWQLRNAADVAGFKAKVPSEMRPHVRDSVVERAKHAAISRTANTAEGQTALELLRRLRHLQQLVHESMPVVMPPPEPFGIVG